jgi:hypothetical protein
MFVPHRKHTYEPPRYVTMIVLLFCRYRKFEPHRKHTYESHELLRGYLYLYLYQLHLHLCSELGNTESSRQITFVYCSLTTERVFF